MPRFLHRVVGQLALVGFEGRSVPSQLASLAREFGLGGVVLFDRNIEAPEQVAELAFDVQRLAKDVPLWIAVDQEGGRVLRLRAPFTEWPPMRTLGRSRDVALTERFARALAIELRAVGVSLDLAPVLDVATNPRNPVIGDRALSEEAGEVARLGAGIIRTLQAAGVAACGKHFPGHGDTAVDSHVALPVVEHPPDRFEAVEFVPFRAAIQAAVASIMMAHVLVPAFDEETPASLSPRVVRGLLRETLEFDGLVLSDDLGMRAIADRYTPEQAAIAAVAAGSDAVLLCGSDHDQHAAILEAMVHACENGSLPVATVERAIDRQTAVKARFAAWEAPQEPDDPRLLGPAKQILDWPHPLSRTWRPPPTSAVRAVVGMEAHQDVAGEMRQFL